MCNADMIVINELLTRLHTNIIRLWTFYPPRTPCNIWDTGERRGEQAQMLLLKEEMLHLMNELIFLLNILLSASVCILY